MGCNTFDQNSRKVLSKPTLKQEINKICGISNGISILADKYIMTYSQTYICN